MLSKKQLKKLKPESIKIKVDENGRLSSASEILLQNLLISTELDFNLCSELTGLDIGKLVEIYIKYEIYIDKILKNSEEIEKENSGIDKAIEMLCRHIDEMHRIHQNSGALHGSELTNLCKILDKLIAIKNMKITEFDKISSQMISMTVKMKTLEKVEFGELQVDVDSNYNFSSISDKLDELVMKSNIGGAGTKKEIIVYNVKEKTTVKYNSLMESVDAMGIGNSVFYKYLNSNEEYGGYKWFDKKGFEEFKDKQ